MNQLSLWLTSEPAQRLALVLVHSLWQAALIAALLWVLLKLLPARAAATRYAAALAALAGVVLVGAATWGVLGLAPTDGAAPAAQHHLMAAARVQELVPAPAAPAIASAPAPASDASSPPSGRTDWTGWLLVLWGLGVAVMLLRSTRALLGVGQLVAHATPAADAALLAAVEDLRRALHLHRGVRVLLCPRLRIPAVAGVLWPVLLLPPALVAGVTPGQLRVILAHELAHIRRHDYLINLLQLLVEALLFFNPAVWWLSRQVRCEREACCDAVAAGIAEGGAVAVARTVVDIAEHWVLPRPGPGAEPLAALAWDGGRGGDDRSLLARVRRMIAPGERPELRLPWYGLLLGLSAGVLLLLGLAWGINMAVVAAADLLTPQQRIEQIEQLAQTHAPRRSEAYGEAERITITGTVRTAGGEPLPQGLTSWVRTSRRGYGADYDANPDRTGRFECRVEFGDVYLWAEAPGYAPAILGPLTADPGGRLDNIDVVLTPGFRSTIRLVDLHGRVIPGAAVRAAYVQGPWAGLALQERASDEQGRVIVEHATGAAPVRVQVRALGYQFDQQDLTLAPDQTTVWKLQPAARTSGRVVAADTGEPVPGASIEIAVQRGFAPVRRDPRDHRAPELVLATTDDAGEFTLSTLRDDCTYTLYVRASGPRVALVDGVRAGQEGLTIRMGPPLYVRGRIVGDLKKLPRNYHSKPGGPGISWRNPIQLEDGVHSSQFMAAVDVRDGVGHFSLDEVFPGRFIIEAPGRQIALNLTAPVEDLVIDLSEPKSEAAADAFPTRKVILRFLAPEGSPTPRGEIRADHVAPDNMRGYKYDVREIKDGQVELDVPVPPGRILYRPHRMVGYVFDGREGVEVPAGEEPLVIDVPVQPAGAVFGQVLDAAGQPVTQASLTVIWVNQPPGTPQRWELADGSHLPDERTGRFLLTPLPLGGQYRVVASSAQPRNQARAISDILTLDERRPIQEIELRFAAGAPVHGQIVGEDGRPMVGAEVSLRWSDMHNHGFGGAAHPTDRLGRFRFDHVNGNLPGEHELLVKPAAGHQGLRLAVKPQDKPITVRLRRGATASGVVLDEKTGWPVPGAVVRAMPFGHVEGAYGGNVEARTDDRGRFLLEGLETRQYSVGVNEAYTPGATFERLSDGRTRIHSSGNWPMLQAGSTGGLVQIRVTLDPAKRLRAVQPAAEDQ